jgi:hypothetical protein
MAMPPLQRDDCVQIKEAQMCDFDGKAKPCLTTGGKAEGSLILWLAGLHFQNNNCQKPMASLVYSYGIEISTLKK